MNARIIYLNKNKTDSNQGKGVLVPQTELSRIETLKFNEDSKVDLKTCTANWPIDYYEALSRETYRIQGEKADPIKVVQTFPIPSQTTPSQTQATKPKFHANTLPGQLWYIGFC